MAKDKKGIFGGLFGGKDKEEDIQTEVKKDSIQEAKDRTEKLRKETAAKAQAMGAQKERERLAVKKHVVVSGDTLSGIAQKYYDDAGKYMKIYEANKGVIGDNPDLIQPGMELVIPKL